MIFTADIAFVLVGYDGTTVYLLCGLPLHGRGGQGNKGSSFIFVLMPDTAYQIFDGGVDTRTKTGFCVN